MAPRTSQKVQQLGVASIDDLSAAFEWIHNYHVGTARTELAKEQARGNLIDEVTFVDRKKSENIAGVRMWGTISFVSSSGPIEKAIAMADALARSAAPRETGHYLSAMHWMVNGHRVAGLPTAEQVGPRGNAMLVDMAPYASWLEVHLPNGILYGVYTQLKRSFGANVPVHYGYANPDHLSGQEWKPGSKRGDHPYMVPFIGIGLATSTVKPGSASRGNPSKAGRKKTSDRRKGRGHRLSRGIGRGQGPKS
jgi:hypothetical protein